MSNVLIFPAPVVTAVSPLLGQVLEVAGDARRREEGTGRWIPLRAGTVLRRGTELITGLSSRLLIGLRSGDAAELPPVSCCVLHDLRIGPGVRQLRVAGRFGGLILYPAGDRDRPFRIERFPTGPLDPASAAWCAAQRLTDIVISGERIELRAVTCYEPAVVTTESARP